MGVPGIVVLTIVQLALAGSRFQNMGMNGWWSLLLLIPLINLVPSVMLVVCQPGYTETNRLDAIGKLVMWILIALIALVVVLMLFFMSAVLALMPGIVENLTS